MAKEDNVFFEYVSEQEKDSSPAPSQDVTEYCQKAINDGFAEDVVHQAARLAGNCTSYDSFLELIDKVLDDMDVQDQRELQKQQNIRRSVERALVKLNGVDVLEKIDAATKETYNTTCVTAVELVEECSKTFTPQMMDTYKECKYAVLLCMKSKWVKQSLAVCIDKWDSSMVVKNYIAAYMRKHGATDENMNAQIRKLPGYLPDEIKNETHQLMYMAYKAVMFLTAKGNMPAEYDDKIRDCPEYYIQLVNAYNDNVPLLAAFTLATYRAAKKLELKTPYSYTVSIPYKNCSSFQEALNNALSNKPADFFQEREEEEAKEQVEKLDKEVRDREEQVVKPKIVTNTTQYRQKPKQVKKVDVAPHIPMWFAATFIHIVIVLLLLIFTKFFALLSALSLGAASVGWISLDRGFRPVNKSPFLYLVLGYIGFVGCLVLFIM